VSRRFEGLPSRRNAAVDTPACARPKTEAANSPDPRSSCSSPMVGVLTRAFPGQTATAATGCRTVSSSLRCHPVTQALSRCGRSSPGIHLKRVIFAFHHPRSDSGRRGDREGGHRCSPERWGVSLEDARIGIECVHHGLRGECRHHSPHGHCGHRDVRGEHPTRIPRRRGSMLCADGAVAELGARYVRRPTTARRLWQRTTPSPGRRGFYAIFDADFVPKSGPSYETVPPHRQQRRLRDLQTYGGKYHTQELSSRAAGSRKSASPPPQPSVNWFNAAFCVGTNVSLSAAASHQRYRRHVHFRPEVGVGMSGLLSCS
jgi:hypothetical protein